MKCPICKGECGHDEDEPMYPELPSWRVPCGYCEESGRVSFCEWWHVVLWEQLLPPELIEWWCDYKWKRWSKGGE